MPSRPSARPSPSPNPPVIEPVPAEVWPGESPASHRPSTDAASQVRATAEELSFDATRHDRGTVTVDAAYVDARLAGVAGDDNLAKYIL